jgi:hypothetical protein
MTEHDFLNERLPITAPESAAGRWHRLLMRLREAWLDLYMDERTRYLSRSTCAADYEWRVREWNQGRVRSAWQRLLP